MNWISQRYTRQGRSWRDWVSKLLTKTYIVWIHFCPSVLKYIFHLHSVFQTVFDNLAKCTTHNVMHFSSVILLTKFIFLQLKYVPCFQINSWVLITTALSVQHYNLYSNYVVQTKVGNLLMGQKQKAMISVSVNARVYIGDIICYHRHIYTLFFTENVPVDLSPELDRNIIQHLRPRDKHITTNKVRNLELR